MKMSIGTIFLDETSYNFINEARIHGHWRNFSLTMCIIIQHYRNLLDTNEAKVLRIQQLMKENQDLKKQIEDYRTQIIKDEESIPKKNGKK